MLNSVITIKNNFISKYYLLCDKTSLDVFKQILKERNYFLINEEDIPSKSIEIGPKQNFKSAWSTNAQMILERILGPNKILNIEMTYFKETSYVYDDMIEQKYNNNFKFTDTKCTNKDIYYVDNINDFNTKYNLGFDKEDLHYYTSIFEKELKRKPTNVELFDIAQSNSEHSRHWFFNGNLNCSRESLFKMVKSTNEYKSNSIIAFSDNSSVIDGYKIDTLIPYNYTSSYYDLKPKIYNFVLTAETHNFPTGVAPFPGANTGVGGRIRDNQSVGRGGLVIASVAGYCVGNLYLPFVNLDYEIDEGHRGMTDALDILIKASDGASDYGNKFGEPIVNGFMRSFGITLNRKDRFEWLKPIMFSAGIGQIDEKDLYKEEPAEDMLVIKIGGPAYKIGLGGGTASSRLQDNKSKDFSAVQRGDPEMGNKLNRFIRGCIEQNYNPILSIHDQGAGGMGNVTKEIVYPKGALIDINTVIKGDTSMTMLELWTAEYQEQCQILAEKNSLSLLKKIAKRENVPIAIIGMIDNTGVIKVTDFSKKLIQPEIPYPINLDLKHFLGEMPKKNYQLTKDVIKYCQPINIHYDIKSLEYLIYSVLQNPCVGSKRYLTNKVDRSVTGLVAQQQCVGPNHTPISNYSVLAQSHFNLTGVATSIGEQPLKGLLDVEKMARLTVGEMLTNLMGVKISSIHDIKLSANWMWPATSNEQKLELYNAVKSLVEILKVMKIGIDGGKDSLSMTTKTSKGIVNSPGSLVLTSYVPVPNVYKKVTPDMKPCTNSSILFIDFGYNKMRMGGSIFMHINNTFQKGVTPDFDNPIDFIYVFNVIQKYIQEDKIIALHDRSDGGLITTIVEMCIAGNIGCYLNIPNVNIFHYLFNEELGVAIQIYDKYYESFINDIAFFKNYVKYIGKPLIERKINLQQRILEDIIPICSLNFTHLIYYWEYISYNIERRQCKIGLVKKELNYYKKQNNIKYFIPTTIKYNIPFDIPSGNKYKVGILREEGSNGDREMASAFYHAGFEVWDVNMNDIIEKRISLKIFNGIAFVGGFSYADVLGAGTGWASIIKYNKDVLNEFKEFYKREDTFSLGICNGCQVMSQLNIIPNFELEENDSGRFESRFSPVRIYESNSIFLKNMETMVLGIWCAHKEGKIVVNDDLIDSPIKYVDDCFQATMNYPQNPNGSERGRAAIISKNGRHMAMMPHPERCFLKWQVPWVPNNLKWYHNIRQDHHYTPWFMLFKNAYYWLNNGLK